MSTIQTSCPHCMQPLVADESILGQYVDCPSCGKRFRLQSQTASEGNASSGPERISMVAALVFQSIALVISIVKHVVLIRCVVKYAGWWNFSARMFEAQEFTVIVGFIPLVFAVVYTCLLHYKCWKAVPSGFARTTPGKAVGFLFIPFYNLYWVFPSFGGLGKDCAALASKNGLQGFSSLAGLGLSYAILWIGALLTYNVPGLGLLLDVAAFVIWLLFYKGVVQLLNGVSPVDPQPDPTVNQPALIAQQKETDMDTVSPDGKTTSEGDESPVGANETGPGTNRDISVPKLVSVDPDPSGAAYKESSGKRKRMLSISIVGIAGFSVVVGLAVANLRGRQSKVAREIMADMVLVPAIPGESFSEACRVCKYEVTQAQWKAIMGKPPEMKGVSRLDAGPDKPVAGITWHDCLMFLEKLNGLPVVKQSGLVFRLPTYKEWDHACRAGAKGDLCRLGDGTTITEKTLVRVAWYRENSGGRLHPVGQLEPNAWGLYDMHGNVGEWCRETHWDAYSTIYPNLKSSASDWERKKYSEERIVRGGDFLASVFACGCDHFEWGDERTPSAVHATGLRLFATDEAETHQRYVREAEARNRETATREQREIAARTERENRQRQQAKMQKKIAVSDILESLVRIRGRNFIIGKSEITQEQWDSVMGNSPSTTGTFGDPVKNVSWNQCQEFLKKLNGNPKVKAAGIIFRLPAVEEVDYAFENGLFWNRVPIWTQSVEYDRPIFRGKNIRETSSYGHSGSISLRVCASCGQNDTTPFAEPLPSRP